ncbi:MAG: cytochrome c [Burkholderiaceae bacterium]|nr:cytochrome c [Burkholderiaceae bacterium]
MKNPKRVCAPVAALCAALLGLAVLPAARADEATKPMALRGVMKQLGKDMQAVTAAVSLEDWARVAELAPKIANHDQPPTMEKLRILGWLGADAGKFRGFDGQVHDAATAMGDAAGHGDGEAVIAAFAQVQQGCLGCHRNYRKAFVDHFHEKR